MKTSFSTLACPTWTLARVIEIAVSSGYDGVEVWLETHGDFASSAETMRIVEQAECPNVGVVWDPANCFTDGKEDPCEAAHAFGTALRHVHLRDLNSHTGVWEPVPTGSGK